MGDDTVKTRAGIRARAMRSICVAACVAVPLAGCAAIDRAGVPAGGGNPSGASSEPTLDLDGRWLAFTSSAANLAGTDGNGTNDVFVRDQQTHAVELVSRTSAGASGNAASDRPSISDDGTRVAFRASASNLVSSAGDGTPAIYVRDRSAGTTTRVSVASDGTPANAGSDTPRISGDGRYVAFASDADNLIDGDDNHRTDVFVHDLVTGSTELASGRASGGPQGGTSTSPAINRDGRYVAFKSTSNNLVPGDTNGGSDVFLRDRASGTIQRISVASSGAQAKSGSGSPAISANGRVVAFDSPANDLVGADLNGSTDVFVRDLDGLTTSLVSVDNRNDEGAGSSRTPALSADGRFIAFQTLAPLVDDDGNGVSDIYLHDRIQPRTKRVSTTLQLGEAHGPSSGVPALSGDGREVAFQSSATDLVAGDTDHVDNVFTRAAITPTVNRVTSALARGTTAFLTVRGTYFLPGTRLLSGVPGVSVDSISIFTENEMTVKFTAAADAPIGAGQLVVVLPGTGAGPNFGAANACTCLGIS